MKLTLLFSLFWSAAYAKNDCKHIRAGIEMGFDGLRLHIAKINHCKKKDWKRYQKRIHDERVPLSNQKEELLQSFRQLLQKATEMGAESVIAVGTPQLSRSAALQSVLEKIRANEPRFSYRFAASETDIAKLQYMSAVSHASDRRNLIVWDIRANGMQMIRRNNKGKFVIYRASFGSNDAQEMIQEADQKRTVAVSRLLSKIEGEYLKENSPLKAVLREYPNFVMTGPLHEHVFNAIKSTWKKSDIRNYYDADELGSAIGSDQSMPDQTAGTMAIVYSLLRFQGNEQSNVKFQSQVFHDPLNIAEGFMFTDGEFLESEH